MVDWIDIPTLIFSIGLSSVFQAIMMLAYSFLVTEYQGLRYNAAGYIFSSLGFSLYLTRDLAPDWVSIIIANELLLVGLICFYVALQKFVGRSINLYLIILSVIISFLSLYYFTYLDENLVMRTVCMYAITIPFHASNIYSLIRYVNYSFPVSLILISFAILVLTSIFRAVDFWFTPERTFFTKSLYQIGFYAAIFSSNFFWTSGYITMVSRRLKSDLQESANTDLLTGLPNRRSGKTFLEFEVARQSRNVGYVFSVMIIDLDNFKSINDTFGHDAGDYALITISQLFMSMIRKQDFIARWGGDEFIIVLPQTRKEGAYEIGKRLIKKANEAEIEYNQSLLKCSVSIGVSDSSSSNKIDKVIKLADTALYESKKKNCSIT